MTFTITTMHAPQVSRATASIRERIPASPSACTGQKDPRSMDTGGRTGRILVLTVGAQQLYFGRSLQQLSGTVNKENERLFDCFI